MIDVKNKVDCCGCNACGDVCAHEAITFETDNEGFWYPEVDLEKCVDCHLCEKVCPVLNQFDEQRPRKTLAAICKDDEIRTESSSGGMFTVLAEKVINRGGVVFGARFDERWQVRINYTETTEGLAAFRGSKYLQATAADSYRQCRDFLRKGRFVLYTGTPCQIAGLRHFLRKDYDNLLAVGFVCHGVPSPKVWDIYLKEVAGIANIKHISMRDKVNGWKRFNFSMQYIKDSKEIQLSSWNMDNDYMRAFLSDIILRPSCYHCPARSGKSHSDITIADYWGIDKVLPEMYDDKGTSLVMVHTEKGERALGECSALLRLKETGYEDALSHNSAIELDHDAHVNRDRFFARLDKSSSVILLIRKMLAPPSPSLLSLALHHPYGTAKLVAFKVLRILKGGGCNRTLINKKFTLAQAQLNSYGISDIVFRNKDQGWKNYRMSIMLKSIR